MAPEVPLLYRIVLAILGFLIFHKKLSILLPRSVKYFAGILMGITLKLWIAYGKIAIFMMLILPTQSMGDLSIFWCLFQFLSSKI